MLLTWSREYKLKHGTSKKKRNHIETKTLKIIKKINKTSIFQVSLVAEKNKKQNLKHIRFVNERLVHNWGVFRKFKIAHELKTPSIH